MAKVYFEPMKAVKYVGSKAKVFRYSLAKPKPILNKGDIVIVDEKTAFTLIKKSFGEYVEVDKIEFTKADIKANDKLKSLQENFLETRKVNDELFAKNLELIKEMTLLKQGK